MKKDNNIKCKEITTIGDLLSDYIQKHINERWKNDECKNLCWKYVLLEIEIHGFKQIACSCIWKSYTFNKAAN